MLTDEQIERYNENIQAINEFGRQWAEAMQPAMEQAVHAFSEFHSAIAAWVNSVFPIMREFIVSATPDEIPESALRNYARQYNAAHPHRKISWRKLNRHQRAEAFWSDWRGESNYVA